MPTLAACRSGGESCLLEDVVARSFDENSYTDCGNLMSFDEASYRAAHDCVVEQLTRGTPFVVIFALVSDEARRARAYQAVPTETGLQLQALYYDGYHGENTNLSACSALTDLGDCSLTFLNSDLCLDCAGERGLPRCPPL
jgi:hypothetical protein